MVQQRHKPLAAGALLLAIVLFLGLSFHVPTDEPYGLQTITGAATTDLTAPPADSFTVTPQAMTLVPGETRNLLVTSSDVITYKYGYYLTDKTFEWKPFELTGTQIATDWIYGQAEAHIPIHAQDISPGTTPNYVAIFSCALTQNGQAWNCHGDTWMLRSFTTTLAETGCTNNNCFVANCETCTDSCVAENDFHPQGTAICLEGRFIDLPAIPPGVDGGSNAVCQNNILEEGEACDGLNLNGQTCNSLGHPGEGLRCAADCTFDTTLCTEEEAPQGNGLRGSYYTNSDFSGLAVERIDNNIDFDWGLSAAAQGLEEDGFSIIWEGELLGPTTDTYTLYLEHDDRARLYLDGQLVLDAWQNGEVRETTAQVQLTKGQSHTIKVEYLDIEGTAGITLSWSTPLMMKEVVPQAYLFGEMRNDAPPEIILTSPTPNKEYVLGTSVSVRAEVSTTRDIDQVLLYLDGSSAPTQTLPGTANNVYAFLVTGLPQGTHNVRVEAINDAGQIGTSDIVIFSVGEQVIVVPDGLQAWSNPATWQSIGANKPTTGSVVTIPEGAKILVDEDTPALEGIYVNGELHFANKDVDITADYIIVKGLFQLGSEAAPHKNKVTITLTDDYTNKDTEIESCGTKTLCAMGGKLEIQAAIRQPAWTQLADGNTAEPGDTSITLEEPVEWQAGDEIVVVSTDYDANQAEKRTITSVSADRRTVHFSEPLRYMHFGEIMDIDGFSIDQRAEVMMLTRDVKIQGDAGSENDGFGGHIKIVTKHHKEMSDFVKSQTTDPLLQQEVWKDLWEDPKYANSPADMSHVSGIELYRMGQIGLLGKYPFHWHMVGHFDGSYIKDSSVHNSYQRCYTVHGTYDVRVDNNVAYDVIGHCYFLESFVERDNTLRHNIGAVVKKFPDPSQELIESDPIPSVFWISQPTNHLIENVAAGTSGNGIWIDLRDTGGNAHNELRNEPLGEIRDNTVHSTRSANDNGGGEPKFNGGAGFFYEGGIGEILRLNAYKNMIGYWAQESSDFELREGTFSDNHIGVWQRRDGSWDSVFIAHTDNTGTPITAAEQAAGRSLPDFRKGNPGMISAIMAFYSHSYSVRNTFIGYTSDNNYARGAFSTGGPNFDAPITTSKSTLIRSSAFVPTVDKKGQGPNRGAVVIDADGTLTGTGKFTEVRVGPSILTGPQAGCTQTDTINGHGVYYCDGRSVRFSGADNGGITVTQDGVTYSNQRPMFIPTGKTYRWTTTYNGGGFYTREGYKGEHVILVLPMNSKPSVTPKAGRDTVAQASSISQITNPSTSETRHLHYWDASKNELWLRIVTGPKANNFGGLDNDGTLSPFPMPYGVNIN